MRKKLISILIANVLFLTNAGFTSLAVEQNIDESIAASSTDVTAEAAVETDKGESQEGDGSDLYFDDVEYVEEIDLEEEEYLRSTNNLNQEEHITKQQFNDDKTAILKIIDELSKVMNGKDYKKWLTYIEPDSINYYSNPVNLRNAQKKLPNKAIALRNIEDYFNYVFIPSRKRSRVDEIRYISATNIKAVQVKEDYSTVVYYYFKKINEKWYVHLPPV